MVYDVTDAESFNNVKLWLHEIDKYAGERVNKLLIGNKVDLISKRAVTFEQAKEFADSLGISYIETSAKNASNIDKSFFTLSNDIRERLKEDALISVTPTTNGSNKVNLKSEKLSISNRDSIWFSCFHWW